MPSPSRSRWCSSEQTVRSCSSQSRWQTGSHCCSLDFWHAAKGNCRAIWRIFAGDPPNSSEALQVRWCPHPARTQVKPPIEFRPRCVTKSVTVTKGVTPPSLPFVGTNRFNPRNEPVQSQDLKPCAPLPGTRCPTCGHVAAKTPAERQRASRAKRKATT